jgi:hypothetical protein
MLKTMMHVDAQNYPEFSTAIFYIQSPKILSLIWSWLKPLMDPGTVGKVRIASDSGVEELSKVMPLSSIPREYGGSCTACNGPTCLNWTLGGHFLSTKDRPIRTVHVSARDTSVIPLGQVNEAGAHLFLDFQVAEHDIDADIVQLGEKGGNHVVLKSLGRVTAHKGEFELANAGDYAIRYSNQYSGWTAKKIGHHHQLRHKQ